MVSAWGSTETSPLATDCHFQASRSGNIGVPIPGTELKLVASGDKLEVRVRGPNVTPGFCNGPWLVNPLFLRHPLAGNLLLYGIGAAAVA
jgi:feruloyl-CoA synthase